MRSRGNAPLKPKNGLNGPPAHRGLAAQNCTEDSNPLRSAELSLGCIQQDADRRRAVIYSGDIGATVAIEVCDN